MMEQFHDPHFWVFLATVLFAIVAWKKGKAPLLSMLDGRTTRIRNDLSEAERLRNEAQALLADCQKKHRDAIQTAQKIIDDAKDSAERIHREADQKLADTLKNRETRLLDRISRAEAAAIQELRVKAADLASRAAGKLLQDTLAKNGGKLTDDAIRDLGGRLN